MSATTVTDHQTPGNRPGIPRPANGKPDGQHRLPRAAAPPSPWTAHLRSLVGQPVTVLTYGPAALLEFEGKLVAIDFNHMNCAIETVSGLVLTFKNVHHITSFAPVGGTKLPVSQVGVEQA